MEGIAKGTKLEAWNLDLKMLDEKRAKWKWLWLRNKDSESVEANEEIHRSILNLFQLLSYDERIGPRDLLSSNLLEIEGAAMLLRVSMGRTERCPAPTLKPGQSDAFLHVEHRFGCSTAAVTSVAALRTSGKAIAGEGRESTAGTGGNEDVHRGRAPEKSTVIGAKTVTFRRLASVLFRHITILDRSQSRYLPIYGT
ncbi:hypothetical protein GH714_030177 [Hevea brasiliensis]|uniref:Uncharacterized protein n=1 Tax=Hevea brasiliensis TaxID=3981 RepID=A0A6A6M1N8_HEVBR|nr:hypothetical protein GH714_030177 [Hevea brasiliensis]